MASIDATGDEKRAALERAEQQLAAELEDAQAREQKDNKQDKKHNDNAKPKRFNAKGQELQLDLTFRSPECIDIFLKCLTNLAEIYKEANILFEPTGIQIQTRLMIMVLADLHLLASEYFTNDYYVNGTMEVGIDLKVFLKLLRLEKQQMQWQIVTDSPSLILNGERISSSYKTKTIEIDRFDIPEMTFNTISITSAEMKTRLTNKGLDANYLTFWLGQSTEQNNQDKKNENDSDSNNKQKENQPSMKMFIQGESDAFSWNQSLSSENKDFRVTSIVSPTIQRVTMAWKYLQVAIKTSPMDDMQLELSTDAPIVFRYLLNTEEIPEAKSRYVVVVAPRVEDDDAGGNGNNANVSDDKLREKWIEMEARMLQSKTKKKPASDKFTSKKRKRVEQEKEEDKDGNDSKESENNDNEF